MARGKAVLAVAAAVLLSLASGQEDSADEHLAPHDHAEDALTEKDAHWLHQKMDKNGDGKVSIQEVLNFHDVTQKLLHANESTELFDDIDGNKDGKLTLEEILAEMEKMEGDGGQDQGDEEKEHLKEMLAEEKVKFGLADANGDGALDRKEAVAMLFPESHHGMLEVTAKASFKDRDSNKDGKIDYSEYHMMHLRGEGGGEVGQEDMAEEKREFELLDENADGALDLKEFLHAESGRVHIHLSMESMFKIADKDKDAHLTADEINKARKELYDTAPHFHLGNMFRAKGLSSEL